jgi:alanine-alpha-ketoisovalerate/valine-pyruvate aminotransferase
MLMLFPMMTLMLDAARVIETRLRMMALGESAPNETVLMVMEKLNAMEEAKAIMMSGGNPPHVIDNYQKIVTANVARLSVDQ